MALVRSSALFVLFVTLAAGVARANDTELNYGGTPRPMNGTGAISMKSEYVKVVVGDEDVVVDCRFIFRNNGAARKVRVGFPDEGGEEETDENGKPIVPVKGTFSSFKSWVDGKSVKTSLVKGSDYGQVWHVKRVDFPANGTLQIRNLYTVPVGNSVGYPKLATHLAKYVLHTGSSWRGPLGRSVVEIEFKRKSVRSPIQANPLPKLNSRGEFARPINVDKRIVYYEGPGKPQVSGRTMRFVRTNWRPQKKDDILLLFDMRRAPGS